MTNLTKADIPIMPKYFDRYIALADDGVGIVASLKQSLDELKAAPLDIWRALGDRVYAEGKWTVRDILQHIVDTERVFLYRILSIARGDKQKMATFDENDFAQMAMANLRPLDDILNEMILVRQSSIVLFQSFSDEMVLQNGNGYNGIQYGPLSLGFVLSGHQRWHFRTLEERYYPLLDP